MARANRQHLPGCVWHITHRCHKREFLLKFDKDKKRWIHWLFEAKNRFGLMILDFTVTSNHIHLKAIGRIELVNNEGYELRKSQSPYNRVFDPEKCSLRLKNDHIWHFS
jgi:REP element-mobilizing transposase RayT